MYNSTMILYYRTVCRCDPLLLYIRSRHPVDRAHWCRTVLPSTRMKHNNRMPWQVFSSNEEVEEIATQVLPLLAADYYLGSLLLKLPFTSPEVSERSPYCCQGVEVQGRIKDWYWTCSPARQCTERGCSKSYSTTKRMMELTGQHATNIT